MLICTICIPKIEYYTMKYPKGYEYKNCVSSFTYQKFRMMYTRILEALLYICLEVLTIRILCLNNNTPEPNSNYKVITLLNNNYYTIYCC